MGILYGQSGLMSFHSERYSRVLHSEHRFHRSRFTNSTHPFLSHTSTWPLTCTLCKKFYIGETGRRLGDRFREHLRDVEKDDKSASKPVARHFNLPSHSKQHMAVCGLSLHQGSKESCRTLEQKFIFQIGTLNPHGINERFSFN